MPGDRLSVLAREIAFLDPKSRAVFVRSNWPAMRANLNKPLPKALAIGKSDGVIAKKILNISHGYRLFATADELWKVLMELEGE